VDGGDVHLALDSAAFYGRDPDAANEILARIRSVLGRWRHKAAGLALNRGDIGLMESVLDRG